VRPCGPGFTIRKQPRLTICPSALLCGHTVCCGDDEVSDDAAKGACLRCCSSPERAAPLKFYFYLFSTMLCDVFYSQPAMAVSERSIDRSMFYSMFLRAFGVCWPPTDCAFRSASFSASVVFDDSTDRRLSGAPASVHAMRRRCHRARGIPSGRSIVTYAVFTYGNFTDAVNDDSTSSFHDFSRPPTLFMAPANVSK
jgi:hypothetical protein